MNFLSRCSFPASILEDENIAISKNCNSVTFPQIKVPQTSHFLVYGGIIRSKLF